MAHRPLKALPAVMLVLATCGATAPLWYGHASSASDSGASATGATAKGDPTKGKKLFSKCVPCHKADGSGGVKLTGNATPNWRDARRMSDPKLDDAYFHDCMTKGKIKSGMQPIATLGIKAVDQVHLIAYIRTLAKKK